MKALLVALLVVALAGCAMAKSEYPTNCLYKNYDGYGNNYNVPCRISTDAEDGADKITIKRVQP